MCRYGTSFATMVQYNLRSNGRGATHLYISAEVQWLKPCFLKSTITKKIEANLHKSFVHIKVGQLLNTLFVVMRKTRVSAHEGASHFAVWCNHGLLTSYTSVHFV